MASALTLTTFKTKLQDFLMDVASAIWVSGTLDQAARLALGEYSAQLPLIVAAVLTPAANNREFSLATLTTLIQVREVHFPYTAADPEYPPNRVLFRTHTIAGVEYLYIDSKDAPDGVDVARIFYTAPHTLNLLDSATATTFPPTDDGLLILGAAGHALHARAIDIAETDSVSAVSTPNYAAIASRFLKQFRSQLNKRSRI